MWCNAGKCICVFLIIVRYDVGHDVINDPRNSEFAIFRQEEEIAVSFDYWYNRISPANLDAFAHDCTQLFVHWKVSFQRRYFQRINFPVPVRCVRRLSPNYNHISRKVNVSYCQATDLAGSHTCERQHGQYQILLVILLCFLGEL